MEDIFGWQSDAEWLAILRIGIGLWWLESVRHKDLRDFLNGGAMDWVESLSRDHPIPAYARLVRATALRSPQSRVLWSRLIVLGELSVGLSLVLGLITPVGLVIGIILNISYLLLAGLKDQGEQGQNLMMILGEVVCLATAAGMTWGLDAALFG